MPLALAGSLRAVQISYPVDLPLILTKNPSFRSGTKYGFNRASKKTIYGWTLTCFRLDAPGDQGRKHIHEHIN